jgi:hypothetical protein
LVRCTEIGVGLTSFGALFMMLDIMLFFDVPTSPLETWTHFSPTSFPSSLWSPTHHSPRVDILPRRPLPQHRTAKDVLLFLAQEQAGCSDSSELYQYSKTDLKSSEIAENPFNRLDESTRSQVHGRSSDVDMRLEGRPGRNQSEGMRGSGSFAGAPRCRQIERGSARGIRL